MLSIEDEKVVSSNEGEEEEQIVDSGEEKEEDNDEEMSTEIDVNKSGNHGWADAMNKILHTNKPKRKKTIVLSKAKKLCDVVKKPKTEPLPFELEANGEVKRELVQKDDKDSLTDQKRTKKQKDTLKIRVKPDVLDRERERMLQKIATKYEPGILIKNCIFNCYFNIVLLFFRGVVTLFNAVKKQQGEIETKLKESGPLERKREKVLQNVDKNTFLDVLMGGTKSIQVDKTIESDLAKDEDDKEV